MLRRLAPSALTIVVLMGAVAACAPVPDDSPTATVSGATQTTGTSIGDTTGDLTPALHSQDFCAAMQAVKDADASTAEVTATLQTAAGAATTATDPAAISALNEWGTALLGAVTILEAQYELAKTASGDPTVIAALESQIRLNEIYSIPIGSEAQTAVDLDAFGAAATAITDSDAYAAIASDIASSAGLLDSYTIATCGFAFLAAAD